MEFYEITIRKVRQTESKLATVLTSQVRVSKEEAEEATVDIMSISAQQLVKAFKKQEELLEKTDGSMVCYKNRYGDSIYFEQKDKQVIMTGYQYLRYGFDKVEEDGITMVDPSGGPYLAIGSDLGQFWGDNVKRFVQKIERQEDKIIFTIS